MIPAIAFKENSGVLYIGSSRQLEAAGENCKDVTYASDNETVASVDENGKVNGVKAVNNETKEEIEVIGDRMEKIISFLKKW